MICKMLVLLCMASAGCDGSQPGVVVAREADHYVVSVLNCSDPKWAGLPVREIDVGKTPPGVRVAAQCELHRSPEWRGEDGDRLMRWRYGSQPKGFILEHCAALEPEMTYEIYVSQQPQPVRGRFKVTSNGEVTMFEGPCHK